MLNRLRTTWQSAGWIRTVICVPLFLALWNAPLPWLHRHEGPEDRPEGNLSVHLRMFHHDPHHAPDAHHWHWHFAFLWQMMDCEQSPAGEQPSPSVLITGDHCPCPDILDSSPRGFVERMLIHDVNPLLSRVSLEPGRAPAFIESGGPQQFLETFLTGPGLRDLLNVARC